MLAGVTSAVKSRRGRPLDHALTPKILETVIELIEEGGVAAVTMEAVASRSGTSAPLIYRRWSSKTELLAAAFRSLLSERLYAAAPGDSLRDELVASISSWIAYVTDGKAHNPFLCLIAEAMSDPACREVLQEIVDVTLVTRTEMLARARDRGELLPDIDYEMAIDAMIGVVNTRTLVSRAPIAPSDAAKIVDLVLGPHTS
jgi:AcrR family transcriptional regulator